MEMELGYTTNTEAQGASFEDILSQVQEGGKDNTVWSQLDIRPELPFWKEQARELSNIMKDLVPEGKYQLIDIQGGNGLITEKILADSNKPDKQVVIEYPNNKTIETYLLNHPNSIKITGDLRTTEFQEKCLEEVRREISIPKVYLWINGANYLPADFNKELLDAILSNGNARLLMVTMVDANGFKEVMDSVGINNMLVTPLNPKVHFQAGLAVSRDIIKRTGTANSTLAEDILQNEDLTIWQVRKKYGFSIAEAIYKLGIRSVIETHMAMQTAGVPQEQLSEKDITELVRKHRKESQFEITKYGKDKSKIRIVAVKAKE